MDSKKKTKWIVFFVVLGLAIGASEASAQACCAMPLAESSAPAVVAPVSDSSTTDFSVPTLDGRTFTLSAHRGKPVVMFVMAYWCTTCFGEAGELAKLHEVYKDQVVILALDVDPSSTLEGLSRFKKQVGNPEYTWAFDRGGNVTRSFKIKALETTIIFNRSGEVVYTDLRPTSYKTLEYQIERILRSSS